MRAWSQNNRIPKWAKEHLRFYANGPTWSKYVYRCEKCYELFRAYKDLRKHKAIVHSY